MNEIKAELKIYKDGEIIYQDFSLGWNALINLEEKLYKAERVLKELAEEEAVDREYQVSADK